MPRFRNLLTVAAVLSLAALTAAPATAQEDATAAAPMTVEVGGVEYAFTGLPTSLPAGTELGFTNSGAEVHELVLLRIADETTETLEELLAMEAEGRDPMEEGLVEFIGGAPLFAAPGTTAEGTLPLEREGRYIALCFIPQGLTDMSLLESLGPDADPADAPPAAQALMANPPHLALGMIQEFLVTAAGTEVGPLPEAVPMASVTRSSAPAEGRIVELDLTSNEITQDGQKVEELDVTIGEEVTFRVSNSSGLEHNFRIGTKLEMINNKVEGLPGVPVHTEGVREFIWVVPENVEELRYGCTVHGHYVNMKGSFVVGE